jgi:hypothetical protein
MDDPQGNRVYRWLGDAASRFTNVSMLDMDASICPDGVCSAERQGMVVFRDGQHLTGSFAASLGPVLAEKLGIGPGGANGNSAVSSPLDKASAAR